MSDTNEATAAPPKTTLSITVDGRPHEARPGQLVIDACEDAGTYVPRFCYHPRMNPVGMCRQCLVEVDGPRGPMLVVSCMTPVAEGQVVHTETDTVKRAQEGVLELLLVNHPLDCPVCDKGGECPLQDQAMSHGPGESRFVEEKRHFEKPIPISDLVFLDRERCVLCDRCTRFADEVAGDKLIKFVNRGNQTQVLTFPNEPFSSYFSGNTVQICPVGALTAKPYRFKARPWDLEQVESTCTSCAVGCRVVVQSSRDELLRLQGVDSDPVNWGWLCDRGRFNFESANSELRLGTPAIKQGDTLVEASWAEAMAKAVELIRSALASDGPSGIGIIGGARGSNEDAFAWARLAADVIGTTNVDAQLGDGLPAELLGLPRATIDDACSATTLVLLGVDLKEELPVLYLRVRDAAEKRTIRLVELSQMDSGLTRYAWKSLRHRSGEQVAAVRDALADADISAQLGSGRVVVIAGRGNLAEGTDWWTTDALASLLAAVPSATVLPAFRRGNVVGALQVGLRPTAGGSDTRAMLEAAASGKLACLVLLGADPLLDFPDADLARRGLAGARSIIAVDSFVTTSSQHADVVLAAAGYGEKGGTTTNLEGRVTTLAQKVTVVGTARPDWMIATELAQRLGADLGFRCIEDITDTIASMVPGYAAVTRDALRSQRDGVLSSFGTSTRIEPKGEIAKPPNGYDHRLVVSRKLYDRAVSTQLSPSLAGLAAAATVHLHPLDLDRLGASDGTPLKVTSGAGAVVLDAVADAGIPRGAAWVPFNQANVSAADLLTSAAGVTDVRIETLEAR
ncbi:MAG: NADH-quinone oxidoreductase subunit NuoG [Acidimicrobiia bacterium]